MSDKYPPTRAIEPALPPLNYLQQCHMKVAQLTEDWHIANKAAIEASEILSERTTALTQAQIEFDEAYKSARANAPQYTEWGQTDVMGGHRGR